MAYDEDLAERTRECLAGEPGVSERKMFGGLGFMVDRKMAVAVSGSGGLMARVDPTESATLVAQDGVAPMVMHGKEMAGWVMVAPDVLADDAALKAWVDRGVAFVATLPPK